MDLSVALRSKHSNSGPLPGDASRVQHNRGGVGGGSNMAPPWGILTLDAYLLHL